MFYIYIYERRSCMSITENIKKNNVIGWFRSTSPDPEMSVRFQYATMTSVWYMPHSSFARLFLRIYPSQPSLCSSSYIHIIGLFRSTVLWARRALKRSKHVSTAPQWFFIRPTSPFELFSIAYRLVANFPFFFAPLEAVVRTLVLFDSINFVFNNWAKSIADPPHTLSREKIIT